MTSLISPTAKTLLNSVMGQVHDTYAREIVVVHKDKKTLIGLNPAYNSVYRQQAATTQASVSNTIQARIFYLNSQGKESSYTGDVNMLQLAGQVRIKVTDADWATFTSAERFEVDGVNFEKFSPPIQKGLFGSGFTWLYLKPVN